MRLPSILFALVALAPSLTAAEPSLPAPASLSAVEFLAGSLTGNFDNLSQTRADRGYQHVVLHAVRLWPERTDGPWLYVEQSLHEGPDLPYRQRVLQLAARPDNVFEVRVFTLPNPVALTGAWRTPALFAKLAPADLLPREGCTIFLRVRPDGAFHGTTEGQGCASELRGAAYATTEMTVTPDQQTLWERGFNKSGIQLWGFASGGYVFQRVR